MGSVHPKWIVAGLLILGALLVWAFWASQPHPAVKRMITDVDGNSFRLSSMCESQPVILICYRTYG